MNIASRPACPLAEEPSSCLARREPSSLEATDARLIADAAICLAVAETLPARPGQLLHGLHGLLGGQRRCGTPDLLGRLGDLFEQVQAVLHLAGAFSIAITVALVSSCTPSTIVAISAAEALERSASRLTSSATTAKPRPSSPALAASMAALRASRLVWSAISLISSRIPPISSTRLARAAVRLLVSRMSCSASLRFSAVSIAWPATRSTVSAIDADVRASSSSVAELSVTAAVCWVVVAASPTQRTARSRWC